MNLNELREMVSKDITIDETNLDQESLKTPQLHNKYLIFFSDEMFIHFAPGNTKKKNLIK